MMFPFNQAPSIKSPGSTYKLNVGDMYTYRYGQEEVFIEIVKPSGEVTEKRKFLPFIHQTLLEIVEYRINKQGARVPNGPNKKINPSDLKAILIKNKATLAQREVK